MALRNIIKGYVFIVLSEQHKGIGEIQDFMEQLEVNMEHIGLKEAERIGQKFIFFRYPER